MMMSLLTVFVIFVHTVSIVYYCFYIILLNFFTLDLKVGCYDCVKSFYSENKKFFSCIICYDSFALFINIETS